MRGWIDTDGVVFEREACGSSFFCVCVFYVCVCVFPRRLCRASYRQYYSVLRPGPVSTNWYISSAHKLLQCSVRVLSENFPPGGSER